MNRVDMASMAKNLGLALLACACTSCLRQDAPKGAAADNSTNVQIYLVKGTIKELKADGKTVVIRHEEVPNYMPAMTMPFEVKDPAALAGLSAGDEVSFRMLVTQDEGWIDQITKLGTTNVSAPPPRETFRRARIVEPLNIGDPVPDYPFTNELGQAFSLGQFRGQSLAITFIFTRCPFPNFCPRMSENYVQAYKKLSAMKDGPKNWRLLSLSFDPEFDTPAVLKNYAARYQYDTNHWSFATGAMIEIDAITEQFGLVFPREGINFNHNLRTAVINAQGKVHKVFIGNEWKVDDFVAQMVDAAAAGK